MSRLGAEEQGPSNRLPSWFSALVRGLRLFLGGNPDGFVAVSLEPRQVAGEVSRRIKDRLFAQRLAVVARRNRRVVCASRRRIESYSQDRQRAVRSAVLKRQVASPIQVPLSSHRPSRVRESVAPLSRVIPVDFRRGVSRPMSRTTSRTARAA